MEMPQKETFKHRTRKIPTCTGSWRNVTFRKFKCQTFSKLFSNFPENNVHKTVDY